MSAPKFRDMTFGVTRVTMREGEQGTRYMAADQDIAPYAQRLTDRLVHWSQEAPTRTLFARRQKQADGSTGDWRHVSYAEALQAARRIGQGLLNQIGIAHV